jgi:hypothetical protein
LGSLQQLWHWCCHIEVEHGYTPHQSHSWCMWSWRTDTANQRGGSEWESIKILLEGDGNSNKMNTASNTSLRVTTQIGQAHVATGVPLDLGTNTQPSDPRT